MTKCCAKADVVSTGTWTEVSALPVAVIGGGPVGMAAVAHLLQRSLEPILFEAAPTVGAAPLAWGPREHVLALALQHRPGVEGASGKARLAGT